jgi:hypothetical protein
MSEILLLQAARLDFSYCQAGATIATLSVAFYMKFVISHHRQSIDSIEVDSAYPANQSGAALLLKNANHPQKSSRKSMFVPLWRGRLAVCAVFIRTVDSFRL